MWATILRLHWLGGRSAFVNQSCKPLHNFLNSRLLTTTASTTPATSATSATSTAFAERQRLGLRLSEREHFPADAKNGKAVGAGAVSSVSHPLPARRATLT